MLNFQLVVDFLSDRLGLTSLVQMQQFSDRYIHKIRLQKKERMLKKKTNVSRKDKPETMIGGK